VTTATANSRNTASSATPSSTRSAGSGPSSTVVSNQAAAVPSAYAVTATTLTATNRGQISENQPEARVR
jgi:hypothetical protein